jgi:hypothetical protein
VRSASGVGLGIDLTFGWFVYAPLTMARANGQTVAIARRTRAS